MIALRSAITAGRGNAEGLCGDFVARVFDDEFVVLRRANTAASITSRFERGPSSASAAPVDPNAMTRSTAWTRDVVLPWLLAAVAIAMAYALTIAVTGGFTLQVA